MTDPRSPILGRIARVAVIAFALFVLGWLVVNAQRNASRGAAAPAPAGDDAPSSAERLLRDPVVGPVEYILVPAPDRSFLFSSKFAAPVVPPPASVPTYLPSSKTITPVVTPAPPVLFFPSSKAGKPGVLPPARSSQDQRQ